MKKKNKQILAVLAVFVVTFAVTVIANRNGNAIEKVEITPTAVPIGTAALGMSSPADEPVPTVMSLPAREPVPTVTALPAREPVPTVTPLPVGEPAPTVTPLPVEESVTPLPAVCLGRIRMGDTIWGEVYENRTFVITGTGSTYDYDELMDYYMEFNAKGGFELLESGALRIIVEEGITRIGSYSLSIHCDAEYIQLPDTLIEIAENAFFGTGMAQAQWVGLDTERIKVEKHAFTDAQGEGLEALDSGAVAVPTAVPTNTPKPTPTEFPVADLEHPIEVVRIKAGDTAHISVWDNGYVYVQGSGNVTVRDIEVSEQLKNTLGCETLAGKVGLTHIIVEEGITLLGESSLYMFSSRELQHIELPSTLTVCQDAFGSAKNTLTCTLYSQGERKTVTIYRYDSFERYTTIDDQIQRELK